MSSLKVFVAQDDNSREYTFHHKGSITLGSDEGCDVPLISDEIKGKVLQVKILSGKVYVKEIAGVGKMILDSIIIPHMREVLYKEGQILSIANTSFQIRFSIDEEFAVEPPPFSQDVLKLLKVKEHEIRKIDHLQQKKVNDLEDTEQKLHQLQLEKNSLEIEYMGLKGRKDEIDLDINRKKQKSHEEESKLLFYQEQIAFCTKELSGLERSISEQRMTLDSLGREYEDKIKLVHNQKDSMSALDREKAQVSTSINDLKQEYDDLKHQVNSEAENVRAVLHQLDSHNKEKAKVEGQLYLLKKDEKTTSEKITDLELILKELASEKDAFKSRIDSQKKEIDKERVQLKIVQDRIGEELSNEKRLQSLNEELRLELIKVENKLSIKKNQFNQLEYQGQELSKKVHDLMREIEVKDRHLKDLVEAEKREEDNLALIKKNIRAVQDQSQRDKEKIKEEFTSLRLKHHDEIKSLNESIEGLKVEKYRLQGELLLDQESSQEIQIKNHLLQKKQTEIQELIEDLERQKADHSKVLREIQETNQTLGQQKNKLEHEISVFKIKLLDSESYIKQKEKEAFLEMENLKREERSKLMAERYSLMNDVEAQKQRAMFEVEAQHKMKEESLSHLVDKAKSDADVIMDKARQYEQDLSHKAAMRLRAATDEALKREAEAHQRVTEALNLFHEKESEGERILAHAKSVTKEIREEVEKELLEKRTRAKENLARFQERGLLHLKSLQEHQVKRLLKQEKESLERFEQSKRREYKKIAGIRNEELARRSLLMKETAKDLAELKKRENLRLTQHREKVLHEINLLKEKQETEIAEMKKTVLEHMNQSKVQYQEKWQEELKREKESFEAQKKLRIHNATEAMYNIVILEAQQPEGEMALKRKIQSSLEMAIHGKGQSIVGKAEQILDFNPQLKKKAAQVVGKYFLRFGIPAAVATIMIGDIGSLRTGMQNQFTRLLKQSESASDLFVKNQQEEWKQKYTYSPETTVGYKDSYTDNVIYTTDFPVVMENEAFQNDWILSLHDFMVNSLELSEEIAINYISSEGAMLKDMYLARKDLNPQFLDQGLKKMRDLEKNSMGWVNEKINDPEKYQKFVDFRKSFYDKFYTEKHLPARGLATEKKGP